MRKSYKVFPNKIGKLDKEKTWDGKELGFIFREMAPYKMKEHYNFYDFREFTYTDYCFSKKRSTCEIFTDGELNLVFIKKVAMVY